MRPRAPLGSERDVLERLYREHHASVFAYVARRAGRDVAHDIVADTFLVAWRKLHSVPAQPLPWLIGIARNRLANHDRSARRRHRLLFRLEAYAPRNETDGAEESSPEKHGLAEAFGRLSDADREILALVAWEELSLREASLALGVSYIACRVRFHRAKARFKQQMQAIASQSGPKAIATYQCPRGGVLR